MENGVEGLYLVNKDSVKIFRYGDERLEFWMGTEYCLPETLVQIRQRVTAIAVLARC